MKLFSLTQILAIILLFISCDDNPNKSPTIPPIGNSIERIDTVIVEGDTTILTTYHIDQTFLLNRDHAIAHLLFMSDALDDLRAEEVLDSTRYEPTLAQIDAQISHVDTYLGYAEDLTRPWTQADVDEIELPLRTKHTKSTCKEDPRGWPYQDEYHYFTRDDTTSKWEDVTFLEYAAQWVWDKAFN